MKIDDIKQDMDPQTIRTLSRMYAADSLLGTESGDPVALDGITKISIEQGALLHQLICDNSAARSLEIGFAYGFSTVWILDALRLQAEPLHIAIDPFEKSQWLGVGLAQVDQLKIKKRFEWIPELSMHALSDLIRRRESFELIYIDGMHRFDDVLVDFYLSDQILRPGGLIVLDDLWMPSIQTVTSFIVENRAYEREASAVANVAVLRKVRNDDRDWRHFNRFRVGEPNRKLGWIDRLLKS